MDRFSPRLRALIMGMALGAATSSCSPSPPSSTETQSAPIDAKAARALMVAKYQQLFADVYYRVDGEYHLFPDVRAEDFKDVSLRDGIWDVRCDPLVGLFVVGRVALDGSWVELDRVGVANH